MSPSSTHTHTHDVAPQPAGYEALALLYNALMTGLVLGLVTRRGSALARDFVQAHFRRQHLAKFLPGLRKLGLQDLPHAQACALYHYHSNALGGVKTEVWLEHERKAWVRYPPPRWIWRGTAACAIPHEVNVAMLHGWHAHNGVSLGNPRLGFVCTGTITAGQPGLEGYYLEHDHPLAPEERLRFADDERMPRVDPGSQPRLDVGSWPADRLQRTYRSYAMEYVRSMLPTLMALIGRDDACAEIGRVARLIGMQFHDEVSALLGMPWDAPGPRSFMMLLAALLAAQGEQVHMSTDGGVQMQGWRLLDDLAMTGDERSAAFAAWNELWVGLALAHDRFMHLEYTRADARVAWRVA